MKAEYRSAIRSRKLINAALADLLQEKALDKITVSDVVRKAEINRGTFYAHYKDVRDVIDHLIRQTFTCIFSAIQELPGELSDVSSMLLERVRAVIESDLDFYRKVMTSSAVSILQEQLMDVVLDYFRQHEHTLFGGSYKEYEMLIRFCAGGLCTLYIDWFAGRLPITLDELTAQSAIMLRNALSGVERPKQYN